MNNLCKVGINVSLCSRVIFKNNNSLELMCCIEHNDDFSFNIHDKEDQPRGLVVRVSDY